MVARLKTICQSYFTVPRSDFPHGSQAEFLTGTDRIHLWNAYDFDLRWPAVGVLYYLLHKPDGTVIDAYG